MNKRCKKALILAGGKGSRMGGCNKVNLSCGCTTFLDKIIEALEDYTNISVSLKKSQNIERTDLNIIYDTYEDIGPLTGIYEGLMMCKSSNEEEIFLTPCDYPNLTKDFISYINEFNANEYDAVIVRDKSGHIHPLLGIYKARILSRVKKAIDNKDYKVRKLFEGIKVKYVPLKYTNFDDERLLKNINTSKEYEELLLEKNRSFIAISGVKNSGKTTLIVDLIKKFRKKGIIVGTLKHDGHDFQMDNLNSDTDRHFKAGAKNSMIFSKSKFMYLEKNDTYNLDRYLSYFKGCHLVLLEGLKSSDLPKIEIIREEVSKTPSSSSKNLLFYATDVDELLRDKSVKSIHLCDRDKIFNQIFNYIKENRCLI